MKFFHEILNGILNTIKLDPELRHCHSLELLGDTNIDLLKFNIHNDTSCYIDILLNQGMLPLITLPTRIKNRSATLIDHIMTNAQDDIYDTGILLSDISDHLPVFYIKHCKQVTTPPQYIKSRKVNDSTIPKFQRLISETSWDNIINENRPEYAYQRFFDTLNDLADQAFPEQIQKLSLTRLPIQPWITPGILISRKTKQKLTSLKIRKPSTENINKLEFFGATRL